MKGWIEVNTTIQSSVENKKRWYQVSNIRWIGASNNHGHSALQTLGDDFIVTVKESYEELQKKIAEAVG